MEWLAKPGGLLNPGLLHCRQILYGLSHKGSSKIGTTKNKQESKGKLSASRKPQYILIKFHLSYGAMTTGPILSQIPFLDRGESPVIQETVTYMSKSGAHRPTGEFQFTFRYKESEGQFKSQTAICSRYFNG